MMSSQHMTWNSIYWKGTTKQQWIIMCNGKINYAFDIKAVVLHVPRSKFSNQTYWENVTYIYMYNARKDGSRQPKSHLAFEVRNKVNKLHQIHVKKELPKTNQQSMQTKPSAVWLRKRESSLIVEQLEASKYVSPYTSQKSVAAIQPN